VFNRGDGQDLIVDRRDDVDFYSGGYDAVEFGAGISWDSLIFTASGSDIYINIADTSDGVRLAAETNANYRVEELRFADGTVKTYADMIARIASPPVTTPITGTTGNDVLAATAAADAISANAGNDTITYLGDDGSFDVLDGGTGTDTVLAQADNTVIGLTSFTGIESFSANGFDNVLILGSSLANTFNFVGVSVNNIVIDGGAGNDTITLFSWFGDVYGGDGDDTINAGNNNAVIHGGWGADALFGGAGDDIYQFEIGDGQDTITDTSGVDRIEFGVGISAADVAVSLVSNSSTLCLTIGDGADRITINNGSLTSGAIETIGFADGTHWTFSDLITRWQTPTGGNDIIVGTSPSEMLTGGAGDDQLFASGGVDTLLGGSGNDTLTGSSGDDILAGGTGNDSLAGAAGNDVYRFASGDGQDTITDTGGTDRLEFGAGISAADVTVALGGDSSTLRITFRNSDDRVTINNGSLVDGRAIESFAFADGTVWNFADIALRWQTGTPGSDIILGTTPSETLAGGAGNDQLYASGGTDTLLGEAGDDTLTGSSGVDILGGGVGTDSLLGGMGNDIYRWGRGDGNDSITDTGGTDRVEITAGVLPGDIDVIAPDTASLILRIRDTGEELKLLNVISSASNSIESVVFADGTTWSSTDLRNRTLIGTLGGDTLAGTAAADMISGRSGNDKLSGLAGDDVISGDSGDDTLDGGPGSDRLAGGPGGDVLTGGAGADTYVFASGDGVDTIEDMGDPSNDTLRIEGYTLSQIRFGALGDDLIVRFADSGDRIIVRHGLASGIADAIETFDIVLDSVTLSLSDIRSRLVDEVAITGKWLVGQASDDVLTGGAGEDYLRGGEGADILVGGDGNDQFADLSSDGAVDILTGGAGRDIFYFLPTRVGTSPIVADTITDFQAGAGGDIIRLLSSNPNPFEGGGIWLSQSGNDTLVMLRGTTGPDEVVVRLADVTATAITSANFDGVPIAFDNSISINDNEIGNSLNAGPLNDRIFGNGGADTINGYAGDDKLAGGADNDVIDGGFGNDLIAGQEGADHIIGGAGSDIMAGGTGDDTIVGYGDGSLASDADVFEGGEGDDVLQGGSGADVYHFARGDGDDTVTDLGGIDRIEFAAGIAQTNVSIAQFGDDLELRVDNGGGRIRLIDAAVGGATSIEAIAFADGTSWTWADVLTRSILGSPGDDALRVTSFANALEGLGGNDTLTGSDHADTLIGGTGDDYLAGGIGDDRYVFNSGDGQDVIDDHVGSNSLTFGAGITPSQVRLVRNNRNVVLEIIGTGDRIDLGSNATQEMGIQQVNFANGTVWTASDLIAMAQTPTAADDMIYGSSAADAIAGANGDDTIFGLGGNDSLQGNAGSDHLEGGAGNDIYLFSRGDGQDVIVDSDGTADAIEFGAGVGPADILVTQSRDGSQLILALKDSDNRITIDHGMDSGRIEQVRFADGTQWSYADLLQRLTTDFDDVIYGDEGANTLAGGLGSDVLIGHGGDDLYRYQRGDGRDIIRDESSSTGDRLEITGYTASEIRFVSAGNGSNDVIIKFADASDEIVLTNALMGSSGIETVLLTDDSSSFDVAAIRMKMLADSATDGDDVIFGTADDDSIMGGLGNDLLSGNAGNDVYLYRSGDGDDRIDAFGTGQDEIHLADYNASDILFAVRGGPDSNDFVIRFADGNDRLILSDALADENGGSNSLKIVFADGSIWDRDAMRARAVADTDTNGNDTVQGFSGNDTFLAKAGNDLLLGAAGSDSYIFGAGDGDDTVEDSSTSTSANDTIQFTDFVSTETSVTRLGQRSDSVVFHFQSSANDSVTVISALAADRKGIESYSFADGVTWTKETVQLLLDNRTPVATDDGYFSVITGQPLTIKAIDLLRNDFDADEDTLHIVSVDAGEHGIATVNSQGGINFTATDGYYGPATLRYTVSDGRNGFAQADIEVRIRPVATARDDSGFTAVEDTVLNIRAERLLSNDLDGDRMTISQVFGAVHGTVALSSDGNISFTPAANFNGRAEFSYVANTPEGGISQAKVFVDVSPVNDAPSAGTDNGFVTSEGSPILINPQALLANDSDVDGNPLVLQSLVSTANVQVSLTANGAIEVRPRDYFWGSSYFEYVVADPSGATATGRVNITVTAVNDPPEAHDDRFETTQAGEPIYEDNPIVISAERLLANDVEHDGEALRITAVRNSHGGQAQLLENNTVLFEPGANFNGDAWFEYQITDDHSGFSWARATIAYAPVNDRPVVNNDHYNNTDLLVLKGFEDQSIEIPISELLKNDYDVEGFQLSFDQARDAVHGDIEITDHGTIIFTPDPDYWGEATFAYTASDPEGAVNGATVTLWFENVGDGPPVAVTDTIYVNEDVPTVIPIATLLANDTDIDRDPIEFLGWQSGSGLNGTLEYDADGNILFTPRPDATASSSFLYNITDNRDGPAQGLVNLVIIPSNDDPTVVDDEGFVTPLGIPLVVRASDVMFNDFDVEQADHNGDGIIDDDLDDPNRARPTFVGVDAVLDTNQLALGNRISVGTFEVIEFRGEKFIAAHFADGFTGNVTIEYRIADAQGAQDVGFIQATVADFYAGLLKGSALIDYIEGGATADTIRTFTSDDFILAKDGNDSIDANAGDDVIDAGAGDDIIDAGDGADLITGGAGFDTVVFTGSNTGVHADLETRVGQGGFAQGDTYIGIEALSGTEFTDELGGDAAGNRLEGLGGSDVLEGRGGIDTLVGGLGDDVLVGGAGGDVLDGGDGSDTASYAPVDSVSQVGVSISLIDHTASGGDAEGDTLLSIENVIGTDVADTLIGDGADNRLEGGRGDDTLDGGAGNDTLSGGRGADILIGGDGIDVADYSLSAEGLTIDLANGTSNSGDAEGDILSGIEIIQGSYHNDVLRGDAGDNRLRGGLGADIIDGRGGFDTADYSTADAAISVDLSLGQGLAGEASGDVLTSIEKVLGSTFADTIVGSTADDMIDGGFGDDDLRGKQGSDSYLFGFDSGEDVITDIGDLADLDKLVLKDGILPKDVSLLRDGDDLFIELERDDGFLIDTVRVKDHFLGKETGLEEIQFANGVVWDRDRMETLIRLGRFNAADDIYHLGVEDEVIVIDPATLIQNDATEGLDGITLLSVQNARFGSVTLRPDGMIEFRGAPNHFGDAFFDYTVGDQYGRESTARVEVNLSPVNDPPVPVDDDLIYAVEDQILRVRISNLLANDYDVDGDNEFEQLHIVGLEPLTNEAGEPLAPYSKSDYVGVATNVAWKLDGQYIEFALRPDYFGFAGFAYTIADSNGAVSTTRGHVELYIAPVNDAPRLGDQKQSVRLETTTTITVAELMAHVYDVEQDGYSFVGLHYAADGEATDNGTAVYDAMTQTVAYTPDALGDAAIAFDVIDDRGAAATLYYKLKVRPLNDAPIARNDFGLRTLEDQLLVIDPATLLANDSDENGDVIQLTGVELFPDNGKVRINDAGMIEFRPRSDYNGSAGFQYYISDGRGGTSSAYVSITVMPRNEGPILNNDVVAGLEDTPLYVIPAEAFGNDSDPDGDVLFFKRATLLGQLDTTYLAANYSVIAKLANNEALPSWLNFNPVTMRFSGTAPSGQTAPVNVAIFVSDPTNGATYVHRFELSPSSLPSGISKYDAVMDNYTVRQSFASDLEFGASSLGSGVTVTASLGEGGALPSWLTFDPATLRFTGTPPQGVTEAFDVALQFAYQPQGISTPSIFTDHLTIDPTQTQALQSGVVYDSNIALFDIGNGSFSAALAGGKPLPDWMTFDPATMTVGLTGFAPDADAQPVRLQITFQPAPHQMAEDVYASTDRGFTLEFSIDPHGPLDPAINAVLQNNAFYAAQGLFAVDLSNAASISAARESHAPLPQWLTFDEAELRFSGTPPSNYVGAVATRLDVVGGGAMPTMSIISDVVVDESFTVKENSALSSAATRERINLTAPEDFNGSIALTYDATDEKGGVSTKPAIIVYNVNPAAERPDAIRDQLATVEDGSVTIALTDLLKNDRDDDGDPMRIVAIGLPTNGAAVVNLAIVQLAAPAELLGGAGIWSATLANGSALPTWMTIDSASGMITATVPFDLSATYDIVVAKNVNGSTSTANLHHVFNGNVGATLTYTPNGSYAGDDGFSYTITDDRQGTTTGRVDVHVTSLFDPPVAAMDTVNGLEDTPLQILPSVLLANDSDIDGDPISFVGVQNATHGAVTFDGTHILFTPDGNFSGQAQFEYLVTDGVNGTSVGTVRVNVQSTNQTPVAALDIFATTEDEPFEFTAADLLANDSDPDGDPIHFVSLSRSNPDGRIVELPNGRFQFVPDENVNGPVSFSYVISDGRLSKTGSITFDVAAVNDAPIANPDGIGTGNNPDGIFVGTQDTSLTIALGNLLTNDRDVEGDAFDLVEVFDGDQGDVALVGGHAVFTPQAGYYGDAGFHYRVTDVHGATSVGYVNLTIMPDFTVPIAVSDAGFEMLEDSYIDIDPAVLTANDHIPEGSTLTFLGVYGEGVTPLENGFYRFTPAANYFGEVTLDYSITNESGFAVHGSISLDVLPVADNPIAVADALTMVEDTPLTIFASQLLANDTDADRQAITFESIVESHGVTVADNGIGQLIITPDANFNGNAWFDYRIEDSTGATSSARVNVAIAGINDAPVIAVVPILTGKEDQPFTAALPADVFSDVDGDVLLTEARSLGGGALPSWLSYDRATRTFTGTPPADFNGQVAVELYASDGAAETTRQILISISPVNDAPELVSSLPDLSSQEDSGLSFTIDVNHFTDRDGDALTLSARLANGAVLPQWLSFDGTHLTGSPPANFNGSFNIEIVASDGVLTASDFFTLTIDPTNDAPIVSNVNLSARAGDPVNGQITASDVDNDVLQYTLEHQATKGALSVNAATGALSFAPLLGAAGSDSAVVRVADGHGAYSLATVSIQIASAELWLDSDQIVEGVAAGTEVGTVVASPQLDGVSSITFSLTDDAGGRFVIDSNTGVLSLSATGSVNFETASSHSINVQISDGTDHYQQALTVHVTNAPPGSIIDANPVANGVDEGAATGTLVGITAQANDPAGGPITYSLTNNAGGRFAIDATTGVVSVANGTLLNYGAATSHDIQVTASDGNLSSSQSFTISVTQNQPNMITGTWDSDVLDGTPSMDIIYGLQGNDTISAGGGNDTLVGGDGFDVLSGEAGNDTILYSGTVTDSDEIHGGTGNDTILAGADNTVMTIYTFDGIEAISAGGHSNVSILGAWEDLAWDFSNVTLTGITRIDAYQGLDTVIGSAGDDTIVGGDGSDTLSGGAGNDVFLYSGNASGSDEVDGGSGSDTLAAEANNTAITIDSFSNIEAISSGGYSGVYVLGSWEGKAWDFSGVTLTGITRIDAYQGDDTVIGSAGNDTIWGGDGLDSLSGGAGNDSITGDAQADILSGGDGNDALVGGADNDSLSGDDGNDILTGSAGDDTLLGGAGDDMFNVGGTGDGNDSVDGGSGSDTILATAANTSIKLSGIVGIENITANGFSGVSIAGTSNADALDFSGTTLTSITKIDGGAGNDTVLGSAGADTILGSGGDDSLTGGGGNDSFQYTGSSNGFDAVDGGSGTDTILALANSTTIGLTSVTGVEAISGGAFTGVSITGSANADSLDFTGATLTAITKIDGGAGNDTVLGSVGADTILGSGGDDSLQGAGGNDTFQYTGTSNGFDVVDGGAGTDTIAALANSTTIGLSSITGVETITGGSFTGVSILATVNADRLDFSNTTLVAITKIDGDQGNDTLIGSAGSDTIIGGIGDDLLQGGLGNDLFRIGGTTDGFDAIDGGSGNDTIAATATGTQIGLTSVAGIETISSGGFSNVTIWGSNADDYLDFSATVLTGITKISGGWGNDTIIGSAGNDTIAGNGDDDNLQGGDGNDTFQYTASSSGNDIIDGGTGTDTVIATQGTTKISMTSFANIEAFSSGGFSNVSIGGTNNADSFDFTNATLTGITKIEGGSGNDTIIGSTGNDTIVGMADNDSLAGGGGNDTFRYDYNPNGFDDVDGGAGTDTIVATTNSTTIGLSSLTNVETISNGGFSNVSILGSSGNNFFDFTAVTITGITAIFGDVGNDTILGSTGADTIFGGSDSDSLDGGAGNDSIAGDNGDDILVGNAGNDTLNGSSGTDTVSYAYATAAWTINLSAASAQGTSGTETDTISNMENVIGGSGADTITGTSGNNSLSGGGGDDRITGGAGNDTIDGGVGTADVAVFAGLQASYTLTTVNGTTTVVDNQPTTDGNDGTDTLVATEKAEFKGGVQVALATPIALDLDGDGVELIDRKKSKARFDWDGDGKRDQTGWVGKDDGMLAFDRNGDGKIEGYNELSFVNDKQGAKSDLDGLSAFDSNHDGIFSADDDAFAKFSVWRDRNGNGVSDKGELMTLAQAGIASINLGGTAVNRSWGWDDNLVINTGSFTRTDGRESALDDVALNYSNPTRYKSRYVPAVAASRFAEAIASFKAMGSDEIMPAKHNMLLDKEPLVAADYHHRY